MERCGHEQASFSQANPWRLAVLLQAVQKDDVVLCRTRIGHTYLTHSYILKKDPPPQCEQCQCIRTVRHILVECNHLARTRNDIFGGCGVVESVQFHPEIMFNVLSDSEFYSKF